MPIEDPWLVVEIWEQFCNKLTWQQLDGDDDKTNERIWSTLTSSGQFQLQQMSLWTTIGSWLLAQESTYNELNQQLQSTFTLQEHYWTEFGNSPVSVWLCSLGDDIDYTSTRVVRL